MAFTKHAVHHVEMFSVIEPERELIEIQRQILSRNLMIDAGDGSLKQEPDILNTVSMDIPKIILILTN